MNHVTWGLGKTSGMLATSGLGRRVLVYVEQFGVYFSAVSRQWATSPPTRAWEFSAQRIWQSIAAARSWARGVRSRSWTKFTASRSWVISKVRPWFGGNDRSWSDDVD